MNSFLLQIMKRNDTGIDPAGTFNTESRQYRPDVNRSGSKPFNGLTDNAVMAVKMQLPLDSLTSSLTLRDRVQWQDGVWDIVCIDPILSGSRRITITVSGKR